MKQYTIPVWLVNESITQADGGCVQSPAVVQQHGQKASGMPRPVSSSRGTPMYPDHCKCAPVKHCTVMSDSQYPRDHVACMQSKHMTQISYIHTYIHLAVAVAGVQCHTLEFKLLWPCKYQGCPPRLTSPLDRASCCARMPHLEVCGRKLCHNAAARNAAMQQWRAPVSPAAWLQPLYRHRRKLN